MAMQSLFPSSSSYGFTYQVFLSFRGSDTRYGFTGNLYKSLMDKGIHTFIDDTDLPRGDEITESLVEAIENSRIFIPVFSIDYASSSFCLDELVHIISCFEEKGRLVLPVFYGVDTSHVRHHHNGSYGEALAKHEKRFQNDKHNMERLQKWKIALKRASNLSGYHFSPGNKYEYKFIGDIVKCISNKINHTFLHVADYPVGLESKIQQVKSLLDEGSDDGVHMVGIYGAGGLGKSTLARAIYNHLADQFECICFLHNVRECSAENNLTHLQEQLLLKTVRLSLKLGDVSEGIPIIKERLHRKKILLILDDVDKLKQLQVLAGGLDWFGPGSRVIVTTRDKHLLTVHKIEMKYEIQGLNAEHSLELLRWMAFKNNKVHSCYENVLNCVAAYASGFPLVIEIVGSNLFGRRIEEWKYTIEGYEKIPNKDIHKILKVSFDALEEEEQSVFLDIACCFKGFSFTEVEEILHAHYGSSMTHRIQVLVDKSLIKIHHSFPKKNYKEVTLHDLIQDMGKEIVRQESAKEPAKRSRLWLRKDINKVLEKNMENFDIEIIYLDCGSTKSNIDWNGEAFGKMKSLRTLVIKSGNFSEGSIHIPSNLSVLKVENYHSQIPFSFFNKKFENMKVLKFDNCKYITKISNVSSLPNLESFSFEYCENLITIDNSIGFLNKLEFLNAYGCINLKSFPPLKLASLKELSLSKCTSLKSFPEILCKMENIKYIFIWDTLIKDFPDSFENLTGLIWIHVKGFGMFRLPSFILNMPKLSSVDIDTFHLSIHNVKQHHLQINNLSDECLPIVLEWFYNVQVLNLSYNNFKILPECLKECHRLRELDLSNCTSLEEIRGIPPNLVILKAFACKSLNSSSKSMLVNKALHEGKRTRLVFFPVGGDRIPEWFEHQSIGPRRICFWFRNNLPSISLFFSTTSNILNNTDSTRVLLLIVNLFINGHKYTIFIEEFNGHYWSPISNHIYVFDLDLEELVHSSDSYKRLESKMDEAFLKNEWIQIEFMLGSYFGDDDNMVKSFHFEFGIQASKEENNLEDIKFTNPCRKRKEYENVTTRPLRFQPLLKKQKFVDLQVLETEHRKQQQNMRIGLKQVTAMLRRLQIGTGFSV